MEPLFDLFISLVNVLRSLLDVVVNLLRVILPWLPLLGWVGFWTFAVNWAKALPVLRRGGFTGILLLMFVAVLIWAAVAPPENGKHLMLGLSVSNHAGKFIYVTMLTCIALLCGSAQLSGSFGRLGKFPEEPAADEHGHVHNEHGHGHDNAHGGHDHGHDIAHAH